MDIVIVLDTVGDFEPRTGMGAVGFIDAGNAYEYEIEIIWLVPEQE